MGEELRKKLIKVLYKGFMYGEFTDSEMIAILKMLEDEKAKEK